MKRLAGIGVFVSALGVVCGFVPTARAQATAISSSAYFNSVQNMDAVVSQKTRRVTSTTQRLDGGSPVETTTNIVERLQPDREREYRKTEGSGMPTEYERITIGFMQYMRRDGGQWAVLDLRKSGGYGSGSGAGVSSSVHQYTVETAFVDGLQMQLFEELEIGTKALRLIFAERKTWIGEDKLPHRVELTSGFFSPREETGRTVVTYEYDPADLKIEAPVAGKQ